MILRPKSDAELLALIVEVTTDPAIELDTAAMLAFLFAAKHLTHCPTRVPLVNAIGHRQGKIYGAARVSRMLHEAQAEGYMARATWGVPRKGRVPAYSFLVGSKAAVSAARAEGGARG